MLLSFTAWHVLSGAIVQSKHVDVEICSITMMSSFLLCNYHHISCYSKFLNVFSAQQNLDTHKHISQPEKARVELLNKCSSFQVSVIV